MKKVILIFSAIVLVASGVAAVSAYEAHVINVKAHVENALSVNTSDVNFGTVFPQEWIVKKRSVELSQSAQDELDEDLVAVNFCSSPSGRNVMARMPTGTMLRMTRG
jgi:hypothetical protein